MTSLCTLCQLRVYKRERERERARDDSSAVRCWTVDQEVVCWNPLTAEIYFCHALTFLVYSAHSIKWVLAVGSRDSTQSWDLKYESMFFADWLSLVIALTLWLKTIPDVLDKRYTGALHKSTYMHTPQQMWVHALEYALYIAPTRRKKKVLQFHNGYWCVCTSEWKLWLRIWPC